MVVPIRTASHAKGSLLCLPGAGGNAASFAALADALGNGWRVYGLQPRGLNGTDIPHSTVSAAAEAYLKSLEDLRLEEPIHILGHSFGGWVAFEMALKLHACGRAPNSLTIIDSEAPPSEDGYGHEYTRVDILMKLVEIWEMTAECSLNITRQMLAALEPAQQLSLLHERAVQAQLVPQKTTPDLLVGTIRTLGAALRTHYRPKMPYAKPANLILLADARLSDQEQEDQFTQMTEGWRRWVPKLEVVRGQGNHMTALKMPDVQVMAKWWNSLHSSGNTIT